MFRKYNDEEQAMFLLQMEVLNYPQNEHAPLEIAKQKGAPSSRTLRRWWKIRHDAPIAKLVQQKKPDLIESLKELLGLHIEEAAKAVKGSEDIRALDTGIGILVDKLQLLQGEPTEINEINVTNNRARILENLAAKSGGYVIGTAPKLGQGPNGRTIPSG